MLDIIWAGLMIISIICGIFTGKADAVTSAVFSGAENAVAICISLAGCICFFGGIMAIAEKSGFTRLISFMLRPFMRLIFPSLNMHSKAAQAIAMNITANMLGLGNAATPFGLAAMQELDRINGGSKTASDNMITFVVINTATVQLIPTTVAMLRTAAGSTAALEIMPCVWCASAGALIVGVGLANILNFNTKKRRKKEIEIKRVRA